MTPREEMGLELRDLCIHSIQFSKIPCGSLEDERYAVKCETRIYNMINSILDKWAPKDD